MNEGGTMNAHDRARKIVERMEARVSVQAMSGNHHKDANWLRRYIAANEARDSAPLPAEVEAALHDLGGRVCGHGCPGGGHEGCLSLMMCKAGEPFRTIRAALTAKQPDNSADNFVDIVFDGPPAPESGRFVEVEDSSGRSIRFGEWVERGDGYWVLRIKQPEPSVKQPRPSADEDVALTDVLAERERQDAQWGGPEHDDDHSGSEWVAMLCCQTSRYADMVAACGSTIGEERAQMVKVAAVALAIVQCIDRAMQSSLEVGE